MSLYDVSAEAQNDLFEIWCHIAEDSVELANRIDEEFHALFASLGQMPGQGHTRKDLLGLFCFFLCTPSWLCMNRI
jgi:plasmid stabilization system protein ParE